MELSRKIAIDDITEGIVMQDELKQFENQTIIALDSINKNILWYPKCTRR